MSQTLLYFDAALAGIPDNSQQLVTPENIRDFMVSQVQGKGFLEHTDNIALTITDGVWLQINPVLTNPDIAEILWSFDGNNFAFPSYSIDLTDTAVPPGYTKLTTLLSVLEITKAQGGADSYEVSFSKNGVTLGEPESVEFSAAGIQTVTIIHTTLTDVSITTDTYGVQIQGNGTAVDLLLGYFTQQMSDAMLLTDPTP